MTKSKGNNKPNDLPRASSSSLKPNEIHRRINFLHHAAQLMFSQSENRADGLSKLGCLFIKQMKDICLMENIKVDKEVGRTLCKKCQCVFVANANLQNNQPVRISNCRTRWIVFRLNRKRQLVRTCLNCGSMKRFACNRNYLSRNERMQTAETTTTVVPDEPPTEISAE
ncbi:unnamed protein product [Anisakis simplex]|uniref:Ribonuclease P protein subunit p21 n=1 Tax=Anisakis simplex TaxID=6269 RepID=A0A0M3KAU6_ANISI|nr:unnamed protein product [Anisakis simplex]